MISVRSFSLAQSNAVLPYYDGEGGGRRWTGGGRPGEGGRGLGGAERRRGAFPGPLPNPIAPSLSPRPPTRRSHRPYAPSLTLSSRLASPPALSSDSAQGACPK